MCNFSVICNSEKENESQATNITQDEVGPKFKSPVHTEHTAISGTCKLLYTTTYTVLIKKTIDGVQAISVTLLQLHFFI